MRTERPYFYKPFRSTSGNYLQEALGADLTYHPPAASVGHGLLPLGQDSSNSRRRGWYPLLRKVVAFTTREVACVCWGRQISSDTVRSGWFAVTLAKSGQSLRIV